MAEFRKAEYFIKRALSFIIWNDIVLIFNAFFFSNIFLLQKNESNQSDLKSREANQTGADNKLSQRQNVYDPLERVGVTEMKRTRDILAIAKLKF